MTLQTWQALWTTTIVLACNRNVAYFWQANQNATLVHFVDSSGVGIVAVSFCLARVVSNEAPFRVAFKVLFGQRLL